MSNPESRSISCPPAETDTPCKLTSRSASCAPAKASTRKRLVRTDSLALTGSSEHEESEDDGVLQTPDDSEDEQNVKMTEHRMHTEETGLLCSDPDATRFPWSETKKLKPVPIQNVVPPELCLSKPGAFQFSAIHGNDMRLANVHANETLSLAEGVRMDEALKAKIAADKPDVPPEAKIAGDKPEAKTEDKPDADLPDLPDMLPEAKTEDESVEDLPLFDPMQDPGFKEVQRTRWGKEFDDSTDMKCGMPSTTHEDITRNFPPSLKRHPTLKNKEKIMYFKTTVQTVLDTCCYHPNGVPRVKIGDIMRLEIQYSWCQAWLKTLQNDVDQMEAQLVCKEDPRDFDITNEEMEALEKMDTDNSSYSHL